MKIGKYQGTMTLLWDQAEDKAFGDAIRELRFKRNNITQLLVKLDGPMKYSTRIVLLWFLNQRFKKGEEFTHGFHPKDTHLPLELQRVKKLRRVRPYTFRHWVPRCIVLMPDKTRLKLQPGCHLEDTTNGASQLKRNYLTLFQSDWSPEPIHLTDTFKYENKPLLFQALMNAYEVDEYSGGLIETYLEHKMPISRTPMDPVIYSWFCDLEIAPRFTEIKFINDKPIPTSETLTLYDEDEILTVGKSDLFDAIDYLEGA